VNEKKKTQLLNANSSHAGKVKAEEKNHIPTDKKLNGTKLRRRINHKL
jgi:hypothetical protein